MSAMRLEEALDRLYAILARLGDAVWHGLLGQCLGRLPWPQRGVYIFFEPGELRTSADGEVPRVVRVGTHAIREGSRSTLWQRLRTHRGTLPCGRPPAGNHRASIFRHHVGLALAGSHHPAADLDVVASWLQRRRVGRRARKAELPLEEAVSAWLACLLWVEVPDCPGPTSERALIERGAIGLLSAAAEVDPPSEDWLGRRGVSPAIASSGLWNVEHVGAMEKAAFLDVLERRVDRMIAADDRSPA